METYWNERMRGRVFFLLMLICVCVSSDGEKAAEDEEVERYMDVLARREKAFREGRRSEHGRELFGENLDDHLTNVYGSSHMYGTENCTLEMLFEINQGLTGTIPGTEIAECEDLYYLDFTNNALTGTLPNEVSELAKLQYIYLDQNNLNGTIPPSYGSNLPEIFVIDLSENQLTGPLPSFASASKLALLLLQGNRLSSIPSGAFDGMRVDFPTFFFINIASQSHGIEGAELVLAEEAFRGLPDPEKIAVTGSTIRTIPRRLFGTNVTKPNARINLVNLGITKVEDGAFPASSVPVNIDLRGNYIQSMSPTAFGSGTVTAALNGCDDVEQWSIELAQGTPKAGTYDCSTYVTLGSACIHGYCVGMFSGTQGSGGMTVQDACCAYGGGHEFGKGLLIDSFSSVVCRAPSDASSAVTCLCSDPSSRYDVVTSSCISQCDPGEAWEDRTRDSIIDTRTGVCLECDVGEYSGADAFPVCNACPAGKFAGKRGATECIDCYSGLVAENEGASTCVSCAWGMSTENGVSCATCPFIYLGSSDCNVPVGGFVLAGALGLLGVMITYRVIQCRKEAKAVENRLRRQSTMLRGKDAEIEKLGQGWIIAPEEITYVKRLAAGGFGEVWKGILRQKYTVAVKKMFETTLVDLEKDPEIQFLRRTRHPRLVMFMGCGYLPKQDASSGGVFVVLEFCDRGDLGDYLYKKKENEKRSWNERVSLLCDVAEGMAYLHAKLECVHRDLKSGNCLLSDEGGRLRAKVADFGLSRFIEQQRSHASEDDRNEDATSTTKTKDDVCVTMDDIRTGGFSRVKSSSFSIPVTISAPSITTPLSAIELAQLSNGSSGSARTRTNRSTPSLTMTNGIGTPVYMAPELLEKRRRSFDTVKYNGQVDVYSFGMIMYETLERQVPWYEIRPFFIHKVQDAVVAGRRPKTTPSLVEGSPRGFVELMNACWRQAANERPDFTEIYRHLRMIEASLRETAESASSKTPESNVTCDAVASPLGSASSAGDGESEVFAV